MSRGSPPLTEVEKDYRQSGTFEVSKTFKLVAILLILGCGLIHLIAAPEHYEDAGYVGALFVANFVGALLAAFGLYKGSLWGWLLGALVAGGALVLFVVSRLVGLPGYEEHVGMWIGDSFEDYLGIPSLIVEAFFVALFLAVIARPRKTRAV